VDAQEQAMTSSANPSLTAAAFPGLRPLLDYLDDLGGPADLPSLHRRMTELHITRADVADVCIFEDERYQRNMIRRTDWYELVCLCWRSGQRTPIHDHKGSACAFRVVEGTATETRFDRTPSGLICPTWTKHHEPGYVCASAEADIHQVANTAPPGTDLITLHCYTPPLRHFNIYRLDTPTAAHPDAVRRNELAPPSDAS
jgi:cysteine dioxygenase